MRPALRRLTLALTLAGCTAADDGVDDTDTDLAPTCAAPAGEVGTLVADLPVRGTEGLALEPAGPVWVVGGDQLWRVVDGEAEAVASAPAGVGATWWGDAVWVAVWEDDEGEAAPALLEVQTDGTVTRWQTPEIAKPNFLLPTPWGTLLVSDDFDTRIFEWDAGTVSVWAEGVASPNGMGWSPDGATLWVASTFTDPGLTAVAVDGQEAGAAEQVVPFEVGSTPDGLAVAADGDVIVALNLAGELVVWDGANVRRLTAEVPTPASLAFGLGEVDACTLVVTSLFDPTVRTVTFDQAGAHPPG